MFKRIFLCIFIATFAYIAAADEIVCVPTDKDWNEVVDSKGRHYDLTSLRRRPPQVEWIVKDVVHNYNYLINVCDRIYSNSHASDTHAAVWQIKVLQNEGETAPEFECGDANTGKITLVEDDSLQLTYGEGGVCHQSGGQRNTVINLVCKKHLPMNNPPVIVRENNCTYYFNWLTPAACAIEQTPKARKGMGGAAIFFTVLLVSMLVYLIGGAMFNWFVLRRYGAEAFPNYDMWMKLGNKLSSCFRRLCSRIMNRGRVNNNRM
eukprot:Ihof_evm5s111 gene=Ihof_evmTU5s111